MTATMSVGNHPRSGSRPPPLLGMIIDHSSFDETDDYGVDQEALESTAWSQEKKAADKAMAVAASATHSRGRSGAYPLLFDIRQDHGGHLDDLPSAGGGGRGGGGSALFDRDRDYEASPLDSGAVLMRNGKVRRRLRWRPKSMIKRRRSASASEDASVAAGAAMEDGTFGLLGSHGKHNNNNNNSHAGGASEPRNSHHSNNNSFHSSSSGMSVASAGNASQTSRASRRSVHSFASTETMIKSNTKKNRLKRFPLSRPNYPSSLDNGTATDAAAANDKKTVDTIGNEGSMVQSRMQSAPHGSQSPSAAAASSSMLPPPLRKKAGLPPRFKKRSTGKVWTASATTTTTKSTGTSPMAQKRGSGSDRTPSGSPVSVASTVDSSASDSGSPSKPLSSPSASTPSPRHGTYDQNGNDMDRSTADRNDTNYDNDDDDERYPSVPLPVLSWDEGERRVDLRIRNPSNDTSRHQLHQESHDYTDDDSLSSSTSSSSSDANDAMDQDNKVPLQHTRSSPSKVYGGGKRITASSSSLLLAPEDFAVVRSTPAIGQDERLESMVMMTSSSSPTNLGEPVVEVVTCNSSNSNSNKKNHKNENSSGTKQKSSSSSKNTNASSLVERRRKMKKKMQRASYSTNNNKSDGTSNQDQGRNRAASASPTTSHGDNDLRFSMSDATTSTRGVQTLSQTSIASNPMSPLSSNRQSTPSSSSTSASPSRTSLNPSSSTSASASPSNTIDNTTPTTTHNTNHFSGSVGPIDVDDGHFLEVEKNLQAIHEMASEHLRQGEYSEALEVFEEILRGQLARYGPHHYRVGTAYHNIGIVLMRAGKSGKHTTSGSIREGPARAVEAYQAAVQVRRAALGEDHADVAVSLAQLGIAYLESRQHRKAIGAFRAALKIRRASLGNQHPKVAKILNNIGCALYELNELDVAQVAFEEALEIQRELLRHLPPQTDLENSRAVSENSLLSISSTQCNIASIKLYRGEFDEARIDLEDALLIQQCVLGDGHAIARRTEESLLWLERSKVSALANRSNKGGGGVGGDIGSEIFSVISESLSFGMDDSTRASSAVETTDRSSGTLYESNTLGLYNVFEFLENKLVALHTELEYACGGDNDVMSDGDTMNSEGESLS